jgi:hypothetical protein
MVRRVAGRVSNKVYNRLGTAPKVLPLPFTHPVYPLFFSVFVISLLLARYALIIYILGVSPKARWEIDTKKYSEQKTIRDLRAADCAELLIVIVKTRSELVKTKNDSKKRNFEL